MTGPHLPLLLLLQVGVECKTQPGYAPSHAEVLQCLAADGGHWPVWTLGTESLQEAVLWLQLYPLSPPSAPQ